MCACGVPSLTPSTARSLSRQCGGEVNQRQQCYAAEQQYYVYTSSVMITSSWQPYVKNFIPNLIFDYGGRVAALWLDR
jgi:hypothetical protein